MIGSATEDFMFALVIWTLGGIGIYIWNLEHQFPHAYFIGIRFTDKLLGVPLHGSWLCGILAVYCLIRFFVRRSRKLKSPNR